MGYLPVWSPDGNEILYSTNRLGPTSVFNVPATGVGQPKLFLHSDDFADMASAWSPDGRYVAFVRNPIADPGKNSLCIAPTFGDMKAYELIGPFGDVGGAAFSADGKWLAYHSNETGRSEVYIVAFPEPRRRVPVSSAGGLLPKWSSDGKELYYLAEDKTLMAATIQQGKNELSVSKTQALFKINGIIFGTVFDVSRDGKRFLVLKDAEEQPSSAITLIANWPQSLQK